MSVADSPTTATATKSRESLVKILQRQRDAFSEEAEVPAAVRIDRLTRCIDLLVDNADAIADVASQDYGSRPARQTLFVDIAFSITALKHARKHVRRWMRPEKRRTSFPLNLIGGRSRILYQPLGVVGVIAPWNFPVHLAIAPLAGVLAAGNRCMIKPSELTPKTSALFDELIAATFDETEISVVTGGPDVAADFSSLPFDHLLFTGSTNIGRHVMRAAADNLVPVTLELGGKSPVVVGRSADLAQVANSCVRGKCLNAGQICLAPDNVLIGDDQVDAFVKAFEEAAKHAFPKILASDDYGSIVNERHYHRLTGYIADAREKGARIVEVNPASEDFSSQPHHKLPPHLVLDASDDMLVMQEEIFGPLLPVKSYANINEAITYINDHPRPLALYYFSKDRAEEELVLGRTISGGVTVNDVMWHYGQEDLPFGGVGPSGMGSYHGHEGFKQFSHAKAVYRQARIDLPALLGLTPPYTEKFDKVMKTQIKK